MTVFINYLKITTFNCKAVDSSDNIRSHIHKLNIEMVLVKITEAKITFGDHFGTIRHDSQGDSFLDNVFSNEQFSCLDIMLKSFQY